MTDIPVWKQRENERNRATFAEGAYQDAHGVWRWKSNDRVPFDDMLELNNISPEVRAKCKAARDADNNVFFEQYRKAQAQRSPEQIAEERAQARAAFGPGHSLVNIISGERYTT